MTFGREDRSWAESATQDVTGAETTHQTPPAPRRLVGSEWTLAVGSTRTCWDRLRGAGRIQDPGTGTFNSACIHRSARRAAPGVRMRYVVTNASSPPALRVPFHRPSLG